MATDYVRYAEARMKGTIHGQESINVFHFGSNLDAADNIELANILTALAVAIIQCAVGQLRGAVTSDWTLEGVDVQQIGPVLTDPIEVAAAPNQVGLRGTVNASFESILMRKKTGLGGKRNRGRNFLPPPGDADLENSVLTGVDSGNFYSGFLQCLSDKFIAPGGTEAWDLLVLSPTSLKAVGGTLQNSTNNVTNLILEQRLTHLASRKVGSGS